MSPNYAHANPIVQGLKKERQHAVGLDLTEQLTVQEGLVGKIYLSYAVTQVSMCGLMEVILLKGQTNN